MRSLSLAELRHAAELAVAAGNTERVRDLLAEAKRRRAAAGITGPIIPGDKAKADYARLTDKEKRT